MRSGSGLYATRCRSNFYYFVSSLPFLCCRGDIAHFLIALIARSLRRKYAVYPNRVHFLLVWPVFFDALFSLSLQKAQPNALHRWERIALLWSCMHVLARIALRFARRGILCQPPIVPPKGCAQLEPMKFNGTRIKALDTRPKKPRLQRRYHTRNIGPNDFSCETDRWDARTSGGGLMIPRATAWSKFNQLRIKQAAESYSSFFAAILPGVQ